MRIARALFRLLSFAAFTLVMYLAYLLTRPTALLSPRAALKSRSSCFRAWARGVARILGMRIEVEGESPRAPFFLVTNHLGYMDVVTLATRVPCFFVAKAEVARWPVFGHLSRAMNTVFVDRERAADLPRVVSAMEEAVTIGHGIAFFPEGTSSGGERVLPFRAPLFEAPARAGYPVSCASLRYATPPGEHPAAVSVCWWGDMGFPGHFWRLLQLSGFRARLTFGGSVTGADRKELARAAQAEVESAFARTRAGTDEENECVTR